MTFSRQALWALDIFTSLKLFQLLRKSSLGPSHLYMTSKPAKVGGVKCKTIGNAGELSGEAAKYYKATPFLHVGVQSRISLACKEPIDGAWQARRRGGEAPWRPIRPGDKR